jgi:hypothetical protein
MRTIDRRSQLPLQLGVNLLPLVKLERGKLDLLSTCKPLGTRIKPHSFAGLLNKLRYTRAKSLSIHDLNGTAALQAKSIFSIALGRFYLPKREYFSDFHLTPQVVHRRSHT